MKKFQIQLPNTLLSPYYVASIPLLLSCLVVWSLAGCVSEKRSEATETPTGNSSFDWDSFDIQGHRGCRGLYPENTVPAFLHAVELGVTTLELDVVISKDRQVVVSHEPWVSPAICLAPDGSTLDPDADHDLLNIFQMDYQEIAQYDCGSKRVKAFPDQHKIAQAKPLLSTVIDSVEALLKVRGETILYNIETKSQPSRDNEFHPIPSEFVDLLLEVIEEKGIQDRVTIQSFDPRTLQYLHGRSPSISTALLIGEGKDVATQLSELGYTPPIYSPYWKLVDSAMVADLHEKNVKIIPWTVNTKTDMNSLLEMGVDGIISDYPDRLIQLVEERRK